MDEASSWRFLCCLCFFFTGTKCWFTSERTQMRSRTTVPPATRAFHGWRTWRFTRAHTQVKSPPVFTWSHAVQTNFCHCWVCFVVCCGFFAFHHTHRECSFKRVQLKQEQMSVSVCRHDILTTLTPMTTLRTMETSFKNASCPKISERLSLKQTQQTPKESFLMIHILRLTPATTSITSLFLF